MNSKNPKGQEPAQKATDRSDDPKGRSQQGKITDAAGSSQREPAIGAASPASDGLQDAEPIATFDEGERRPSPLTGPDQEGLRAPAPVVSADPKDYVKDDRGSHTEATTPPAPEGDSKRNTM